MNCPKCAAAMQPVTYAGVEVDRCTQCGGLWFDMLEANDLKKVAGSEAIDSGGSATGKEQNKVGVIHCPRDSAMLLRMVVNGQPHIWYESCPVCHGSYFDAGEFRDFKAETVIGAIKDVFAKERK